MTFLKLAIRSLIYHWRVNGSVALGVAAATAVLTGALVIGDSVRESLRAMTLDRLGRIDTLLISDHFFRMELVDQWRQQGALSDAEPPRDAVGVMLFPQATVERPGEDGVSRASNVLVVAADPPAAAAGRVSFWDLNKQPRAAGSEPASYPAVGEVVLNRQLADELNAKVGDKVTIRLPKPEDIPADSPLGEKTDRIRSLPFMQVIEIIENRGLGRFSMHPRQTEPSNAYVALEQLQSAFREPDKINTILVSGAGNEPPTSDAGCSELTDTLHPSLDDLGLNLQHARLTYTGADGAEELIYDYFTLSSDRMILPPAVERAAKAAFQPQGGQPVLAYLANRIDRVGTDESQEPIPYSMVAGIDPSANFQLRDMNGQLIDQWQDDEIVLTSWAAENLGVKAGDEVRVTYFLPESTHGAADEANEVLKVKAITPLTEPAGPYLPARKFDFDERPTVANDPFMTPEVEGITDQESIDDWEVPFVIDYRLIRPEDDLYWEDYATTPKAYVSLQTARRLWGSRFGNSTSYRIPVKDQLTRSQVEERLQAELSKDMAALGFAFRPIKYQQLNASRGNTPFDVLFLMLSFFIIAAALMLVVLLFRLGFEQRARQAGLLLALGWNRRRLLWLLMAESLGVAAVGGAIGVLIGLGYAALMLAALQSKTWWLGAISTPFLEFHFSATSLIIGYLAGVLVSLATIYLSVLLTRRVAARQMLGGSLVTAERTYGAPARWPLLLIGLLLVMAIALTASATQMSGQAQAGAFVGAGTVILIALLMAVWRSLRSGGISLAPVSGRAPALMLAIRSAARNPTRSTLTIGLIASASFLIVSMSAFRLKPTETGTGGFTLLAESSQPVFDDLNSTAGRDELLADQANVLEGTQVFSFRVRPGDDASCGNLYKAQQPRILGVPQSFVQHFDNSDQTPFEFAASAAETDAQQSNPWQLLDSGATPPDEPIPVVIDKETAMYSLQLYKGIGEEFTFEYDERPITFRVAGLLQLSVLHGSLLISEADFRQLFPDINGYRYALIQTPEERASDVSRVLEDKLSDQGYDVTPTVSILSGLMALQNTYLRTFQALGALGLLLGTFGLAAAQLRSVLERRGEMGLLRAAGFSRHRLGQIVLWENIMLLLAGLATGIVAAMLAVVPHMFGGGAAIPFPELAAMLGIVLLVGVCAGWFAARATLHVPILAALREER